MTTYSSRDLRMANLFAMVLIGIGLGFVTLRLVAAFVPDGQAISPPHVWLAAITFLALGKAIALKVGELRAAGGGEGARPPSP